MRRLFEFHGSRDLATLGEPEINRFLADESSMTRPNQPVQRTGATTGQGTVPWWDAKALRMVEALERSITRLRLDSQGEFVAIMNAMEMQIESRDTEPPVVRHLADTLRALIDARPLPEQSRRRLVEALDDLVIRVELTSGSRFAR